MQLHFLLLLSGCEMPIKLLSKYLCFYPLVLAAASLKSQGSNFFVQQAVIAIETRNGLQF